MSTKLYVTKCTMFSGWREGKVKVHIYPKPSQKVRRNAPEIRGQKNIFLCGECCGENRLLPAYLIDISEVVNPWGATKRYKYIRINNIKLPIKDSNRGLDTQICLLEGRTLEFCIVISIGCGLLPNRRTQTTLLAKIQYGENCGECFDASRPLPQNGRGLKDNAAFISVELDIVIS
jgi:hypothetical protein